jgi:spore coat protein U-like protein
MKRILTSAVLAIAALASSPIYAAANGTATGTFDVNIGLTSLCQINASATNPATITNMSFTYTSFQAGDALASTSFGVKCTNSLPFSLGLDATSVTDAATNLAYTLSLPVASGTGDGTSQSFTVNGKIVAGQAGTCNVGSCDNSTGSGKTRTLTVTY